MKQFEPRDWIIIMLIGVIVYFISGIMIAVYLGYETHHTKENLELVKMILTIVSMYIGSKMVNNKNTEK